MPINGKLFSQTRIQTVTKPIYDNYQNPLRLPAEWELQSGVLLTWPHRNTDWHNTMQSISNCYIHLAAAISARQRLLIVTPQSKQVRHLINKHLPKTSIQNIRYATSQTNDTWTRDHAFITLTQATDEPHLLDFCFNGWGMKFSADKDNLINKNLFNLGILNGTYENNLDFVLEGGSIESDGCGTILTTASCLFAPNRNDTLTHRSIINNLKRRLHADRVICLDTQSLIGDDTDGHIDTLARFAPDNIILYSSTKNPNDPQYNSLRNLRLQLTALRTTQGTPYCLKPLFLPNSIIDKKGNRLPANYANFLVINTAVIVPIYNDDRADQEAVNTITKAFPNRDIITIDALPLITQGGSVHCATMQFPDGVLTW